MPLFSCLAAVASTAAVLAPAGDTFAIEKVKAGVGADAQDGVTVVVRDGRIAAIGKDVPVPPGAEKIDGSGLTLLPGFIDGFSDFGLFRPETPAPTGAIPGNEGVAQDYGAAAYAETSEANRRGLRPEVRARDQLAAPDKEGQEKLRNAGFTAVLASPLDGFMPGQPCLVEIVELPPRDTVVREPGMIVLKFRNSGGGGGGGGPPGAPGTPGTPGSPRGRRDEGDFGYPSTLMGALAHLRQSFLDAQRLRSWRDSYRRDPASVARPPSDSTLDALLRALDGELRVAFLVDRENDILRALAFADEFRLRPVILGGKEAWKCSSRLAAARVPVIASLNFADKPERKNAKVKKPDEKKGESTEGKKEEKKDETKEAAEPEAAVAVAAPATEAPATPVTPSAPPAEPDLEAKPDDAAEVAASDPPAAIPVAPRTKPVPGPSVPPPPEEWDVADPVLAEPLELYQQRKKDWTDEVENVERLLAAGVDVALTTRGSSSTSDFFADLRVAIENGLDAEAAVECLTGAPATLFGVERELGTLRTGAAADLILLEGELASKDAAVRHVFVAGKHYVAAKKKPAEAGDGAAREGGRGGRRGRREGQEDPKEPEGEPAALDVTGTWSLVSSRGEGFKSTLTLVQDGTKLTGKLESEHGSADITNGTLDGDQFTIAVTFQLQNRSFEFTLKGTASKDSLKGTFETPFGQPAEFEATRGPRSSAGSMDSEARR